MLVAVTRLLASLWLIFYSLRDHSLDPSVGIIIGLGLILAAGLFSLAGWLGRQEDIED